MQVRVNMQHASALGLSFLHPSTSNATTTSNSDSQQDFEAQELLAEG
jgi:hypothetical protein